MYVRRLASTTAAALLHAGGPAWSYGGRINGQQDCCTLLHLPQAAKSKPTGHTPAASWTDFRPIWASGAYDISYRLSREIPPMIFHVDLDGEACTGRYTLKFIAHA
jgi:hypothetical protein